MRGVNLPGCLVFNGRGAALATVRGAGYPNCGHISMLLAAVLAAATGRGIGHESR